MDNTASKLNTQKVPRRILGALLAGISAGVVPRAGAPYIAIGRVDEIRALTDDLARVAEGQSSMRLLIGRYGSGKSFLLQLLRSRAMELGFVTADADLSPERKLSGEGGIATYRELSRNLAVKASPDGGAWSGILSRFMQSVTGEISSELPEEEYRTAALDRVRKILSPLGDEVGGYNYVTVLARYAEAYLTDDTEHMAACLRWLRGEYRTKTDARAAIGIRTLSIIDDASWYSHVRLLSRFVRLIGYQGLLVLIDECVNLYKIPNRISREANYEKILSMYNDTLQGVANGLMIVLGGTPRFLEDTRRGLFSYEALRSRLSDGRFVMDSGVPLKNMMSPVIRLRRLSDNELLALTLRLRALHAQYYGTEEAISDEMAAAFLKEELDRAGAEEMITPREIIRDFVTLLDLLYQNPGATFTDMMNKAGTAPVNPDPDGENASWQNANSEEESSAEITPPVKVELSDIEL